MPIGDDLFAILVGSKRCATRNLREDASARLSATGVAIANPATRAHAKLQLFLHLSAKCSFLINYGEADRPDSIFVGHVALHERGHFVLGNQHETRWI